MTWMSLAHIWTVLHAIQHAARSQLRSYRLFLDLKSFSDSKARKYYITNEVKQHKQSKALVHVIEYLIAVLATWGLELLSRSGG